jgi:hypothetical protein
MPSIPGNPSGKPCVAIEAAKNTLVISQVKRPLGGDQPFGLKGTKGSPRSKLDTSDEVS